jgi:hypothetical protein
MPGSPQDQFCAYHCLDWIRWFGSFVRVKPVCSLTTSYTLQLDSTFLPENVLVPDSFFLRTCNSMIPWFSSPLKHWFHLVLWFYFVRIFCRKRGVSVDLVLQFWFVLALPTGSCQFCWISVQFYVRT